MIIVKSIYNQTILSIRYFLGKPKTTLLLILFPVMSVLLSMSMLPIVSSMSVLYLMAVFPPTAITFAVLAYSFRQSTLYMNSSLTKNSNVKFYLSVIFIMLIVTLSVALTWMVIYWVMNKLGLTLTWWLQAGDSSDRPQPNIFRFGWFNLIYISGEVTLITFSLLFMMRKIIKDIKIMFVIILILTIITFLFGGLLNTYFGLLSTENDYANKFNTFKRASAWPLSFFYPMFLFPLFPIGQQLVIIQGNLQGLLEHPNLINQLFYLDAGEINIELRSYTQTFLIFIMPYIYVILFGIIGSLLKEK